MIGPEGDFSDSEIKFLSNIKWGCMNRSTILRSETALLAVAAQLQDRWLPSLHLFSEGFMNKQNLFSFTPNALMNILVDEFKCKPFVARQLCQWVYEKGVFGL